MVSAKSVPIWWFQEYSVPIVAQYSPTSTVKRHTLMGRTSERHVISSSSGNYWDRWSRVRETTACTPPPHAKWKTTNQPTKQKQNIFFRVSFNSHLSKMMVRTTCCYHCNTTFGKSRPLKAAMNRRDIPVSLLIFLTGVTLYVIPNTVIYDPRLLCDFLKRNEITSILVTPSLMKNVINTDSLDLATSMKTMRSERRSW